MNSDQLRELAERLQPMAAAPGFDGLDIPTFVAWLRQCAEREPASGWKMVPVEPTAGMLAAWSMADRYSFASFGDRYKAMLAAAPVPQPEPSAGQIEAAAYERAAQECEKYAGAIDGDYNRRVMAASAAIRALAAKEQT